MLNYWVVTQVMAESERLVENDVKKDAIRSGTSEPLEMIKKNEPGSK
jgi:hypothetical protein